MTCEGPSKIYGPIPPDPSLFPDYYKRPASGKIPYKIRTNGDINIQTNMSLHEYKIKYLLHFSARGRLEGHSDGTLALLSGPLAPDPGLHPECYSCRDPPRPPRIGRNATHILERGQRGVVGALLKLEGVSFSPSTPKQSMTIAFVSLIISVKRYDIK